MLQYLNLVTMWRKSNFAKLLLLYEMLPSSGKQADNICYNWKFIYSMPRSPTPRTVLEPQMQISCNLVCSDRNQNWTPINKGITHQTMVHLYHGIVYSNQEEWKVTTPNDLENFYKLVEREHGCAWSKLCD